MTKRITIILNDKVMKKLREKQAKMIMDTSGSVSFSKVINDTLNKYLK